MTDSKTKPWWKYGHVWMVIGGPLVVVVASFITLYLAISRPDPLVSDNANRSGREASQPQDSNLAPAVQARNHAQTGVVPKKAPDAER